MANQNTLKVKVGNNRRIKISNKKKALQLSNAFFFLS